MSSSGNKNGLSNHPVIVACGVLAAMATIISTIILIFTFTTGRQSIPEILSSTRTLALASPTPIPQAVRSSIIFETTESLIVNGQPYTAPTDIDVRCIANEQTRNTGTKVEYNLLVPRGWVIVWDSWKASWPPDDNGYEQDGLLIVYGKWEGKVTIVNGEYCATPVEWADFAINNRLSAVSHPDRQRFSIGEVP